MRAKFDASTAKGTVGMGNVAVFGMSTDFVNIHWAGFDAVGTSITMG